MRRMTGDEWRQFILERPRPAIAAVTLEGGRPHATPVWIDLDGEQIVFTTWHESVKAKALRRDPRISICVDDDAPPFSFVTVEGTATLSDDLAELRRWAATIGGRYMGADRAAEYGERNGVPGELLVRVTAQRVVGVRGVAD